MKTIIKIEGMTCGHCKARVEKTLAELPGVMSAEVDLEAKTATVESTVGLLESIVTEAIDDAGYDVISIEA